MATLHPFPGCCTMRVVVGLGETDTAGRAARDAMGDTSVAGLERDLAEMERQARGQGAGIIVAAINNQQANAVQALRNQQWAHSRWASKTYHPETQIRLYYKRINRT